MKEEFFQVKLTILPKVDNIVSKLRLKLFSELLLAFCKNLLVPFANDVEMSKSKRHLAHHTL